MIQSRKDYEFYLEADRIARYIPGNKSLLWRIKYFLSPDYIWEFQKSLRKLEYHTNCKHGFFAKAERFFIRKKFNRLSYKLGFSISINVFGPGLSIAHYGTIVVNSGAKVGANCRLHACVNIGTAAGYSNKAPHLGDNCYIGPGVKMYGEIELADGMAIGANAVVNKSFTEKNIAIAGIPAKKIADVDTFKYLVPSTLIMEQGLNADRNLSTNEMKARLIEKMSKS
jgi:serine O-acetyltransferase